MMTQYPDSIKTGDLSYQVIRRSGDVTPFDSSKITVALTKAFLAVEGDSASASNRVHRVVKELTEKVILALTRGGRAMGRTFHVEDVQDQAELALMRAGYHKVARAYVLYREGRAAERSKLTSKQEESKTQWRMCREDGTMIPLDLQRLKELVDEACHGFADVSLGDGAFHELANVSPDIIWKEVLRNLYDGISPTDLDTVLVLASRLFIDREPNYAYVSARLLLDRLRREALVCVHEEERQTTQSEMFYLYPEYFLAYLEKGIEAELLDPNLKSFDTKRLSIALRPERDFQFQYLGLQTLYDRYLLRIDKVRFELPQAFFMRVAMGLAMEELDRDAKAIEFYELLSSFDFMLSTPTLFNSGTMHPQLSSCFLTTIPDDLNGIFKGIKDNALLAKYSGGLGNDWTQVRGLGARIKGTNGESQGVIPFLKVANDTALAVNQGGKRKGAVCAYLETWHIDIEEFLDLRKNTGDERRRTHDMHTANWIPDLFMERVEAKEMWTLFSPDETPDLHSLYGKDFKEAYEIYEQKAEQGEIKCYKKIPAVDLWRRMLTMLFETGHPWITFKDPCNIRSPQGHVGTVHSSNLCTEITLNTSDDEVAVCNLGSVNLANHLDANGALDRQRIARTVKTAMRMLDNVIDVNLYTIPETKHSNSLHRPVGLGIMGFQDALHKMRIPYTSDEAAKFADESMEVISYNAISSSVELAQERGRYQSFEGSLWSKGILPLDSLDLVAQSRKEMEVDRSSSMDWITLRQNVMSIGMRNSNTMAIAPTATIANICGVTPSIEPSYRNLFVKSNMSGDFTIVNAHLVRDLKASGLWDEVMISDLKYFDGSLSQIDRIPEDLKVLYATAFEIDPECLVRLAARRQKWIDQSQSLNLYSDSPSGKKLDRLYRLAWKLGLKTTYYLRNRSATHVEKSTLKGTDGRLNAVPVTQLGSVYVQGSPEVEQVDSTSDNDHFYSCEVCQ